MSFGLIWAGLKFAGGWLWKDLSRLSVWQLLLLGVSLYAMLEHFELAHCHHVDRAHVAQRDAYKHQLDVITQAQNEQKTHTTQNIQNANQINNTAQNKAQHLMQSPLPKTNDPAKCRTPDVVMGADL